MSKKKNTGLGKEKIEEKFQEKSDPGTMEWEKDKNKTASRGPTAKIELNEDQLKQLEIMAGLGMKGEHMSRLLGFSTKTLYTLCERDERVLHAIKTGEARAVSAVTQTAFQMAKSGKHPAMTMFWLKCRQKWREVHEQEVKSSQEIVFRTRIGEQGQIIQEQITKDHGGSLDVEE